MDLFNTLFFSLQSELDVPFRIRVGQIGKFLFQCEYWNGNFSTGLKVSSASEYLLSSFLKWSL